MEYKCLEKPSVNFARTLVIEQIKETIVRAYFRVLFNITKIKWYPEEAIANTKWIKLHSKYGKTSIRVKT